MNCLVVLFGMRLRELSVSSMASGNRTCNWITQKKGWFARKIWDSHKIQTQSQQGTIDAKTDNIASSYSSHSSKSHGPSRQKTTGQAEQVYPLTQLNLIKGEKEPTEAVCLALRGPVTV